MQACMYDAPWQLKRRADSLEEIEGLLGDIGSEPAAPVDKLLAKSSNLVRQKWGGLPSPNLLRQSYASSNLDLDEALAWLRATFESGSYQVSGGTPTHLLATPWESSGCRVEGTRSDGSDVCFESAAPLPPITRPNHLAPMSACRSLPFA